MSKKILLVEDEEPIREMLRYALERDGYQVIEAQDGKHAREHLSDNKVDLLVVDWMMPGESGIEFIKRLRKDKVHGDAPIIMLTARVEEVDKVHGLDCGADDYLTKPVAIKELLARIKALLRRASNSNQENKLICGDLILNLDCHQLLINGDDVHLGQTEFNLLQFFMEHKNRVYSRSQLLDFVWGQSVYIEERTVDVHILRLRKILKPYGKDSLVKTIRGLGYMFTEGKEQ